ncbi:hypothetical protein RIF29_32453 [Crotalaria pallida]|uniref:Uncharacterized protein n=1 Tax=Crotalaria pallida TaxID=3830 RepID=A0AAN9EIZ1_CROPI
MSFIIGMNASVEGSRRQLPSWMVQKVASNSGNVVETDCHAEKGVTKKVAGVDDHHERETSKRKPNLNAECGGVKRKRKPCQLDQDGDDIVQKKKKKEKGNRCSGRARKSSAKKGQKLEDPSHDSCDVNPVQVSSDDDDVELTIDDLIAIAEEIIASKASHYKVELSYSPYLCLKIQTFANCMQYVRDHENKDRQETSGRQCESKWPIPSITETGTALDSPGEKKKSSSYASEALDISTVTTTGELINTSTSQTNNPAQDMLDLLLGPLLRNLP